NPGEPLLNVVRSSKPKMLTGLSQQGTWPGRGTLPFPLADHSAIGEEAGPEPSVGKDTERGKAIVFPNGETRRRASLMSRGVKGDGRSDGRPQPDGQGCSSPPQPPPH